MSDRKHTVVLAEAPHQTPSATPYRYVSSDAPSRAVLYSHEEMTAAAVKPVPTLRLATMKLENVVSISVSGDLALGLTSLSSGCLREVSFSWLW